MDWSSRQWEAVINRVIDRYLIGVRYIKASCCVVKRYLQKRKRLDRKERAIEVSCIKDYWVLRSRSKRGSLSLTDWWTSRVQFRELDEREIDLQRAFAWRSILFEVCPRWRPSSFINNNYKMIDGILLFHTESTYTFHLFYSPLFNDSNISQRLNILRNKINKA